ncbi:hypothetical protein [Bradyrhizobium sp. 174]|uniref:hypothetical protein n=1 Tax=Bradyrhizobium sp. 174 TaxID=2782645 RepID=UPI001FFB5F23|nr:hypothetical protein [Bradyrhizobium sp. 174]MCK1577891.1 hypothetical protein [Bradyrhizobium sp. 174]
MIPSCATCKFYSVETCRRSPPVRLPRKFDTAATAGNRVRDEGLIWGWPAVRPTDWCGEHVKAQKAGDDRGHVERARAGGIEGGVSVGS